MAEQDHFTVLYESLMKQAGEQASAAREVAEPRLHKLSEAVGASEALDAKELGAALEAMGKTATPTRSAFAETFYRTYATAIEKALDSIGLDRRSFINEALSAAGVPERQWSPGPLLTGSVVASLDPIVNRADSNANS